MKINEIITVNNIPAFINDILHILDLNEIPEIIYNDMPSGVLGYCLWEIGNTKVKIHIKESLKKDITILKRILAHELCHMAEYLIFWDWYIKDKWDENKLPLQEFLNSMYDTINENAHGEIWQEYADIINKVYGKDYVTKYSDKVLS